jgi:hypothetical protein
MDLEPHEAYSISAVTVGDTEFYGVRSVNLEPKSFVAVECGYVQPKRIPAGWVTIRLPAKNPAGRSGQMHINVNVDLWKLTVRSDDHGSTIFTYRGQIGYASVGRIEIEYDNDPGKFYTLADL